MHPLDRPIWSALTGPHHRLAEREGLALAYPADVEPFAATESDSPAELRNLGALVRRRGTEAILLQGTDIPDPPATVRLSTAEGVQMIADGLREVADARCDIVTLGEADAPEMRALAALTRPGPFLARTHTLGGFVGVRQGGRLLAMAGERMRVDGFTEISGVCSHPDARGRGYAAALSLTVARRILERGERPFLHAYAANTPAVRLYERLGFRVRAEMVVVTLAPAL